MLGMFAWYICLVMVCFDVWYICLFAVSSTEVSPSFWIPFKCPNALGQITSELPTGSKKSSFSFASWQIKPSMFWKVDAPRCTCIALRAIWKSKTCKQCDAYISRFCVCQKHHHRTKVWHWLCMFLVQEKRNDIFEFQELFWPFYSVPSISLPTAGWFPPRRTT